MCGTVFSLDIPGARLLHSLLYENARVAVRAVLARAVEESVLTSAYTLRRNLKSDSGSYIRHGRSL